MNRYECSTPTTPTREIEAQNENEAARLYRQEIGLSPRIVPAVQFVGKVQADRFARFTR